MITIEIAVDDHGRCSDRCEWYLYDAPDCGKPSSWCAKDWERWETDKYGTWAVPTEFCPGPGTYELRLLGGGGMRVRVEFLREIKSQPPMIYRKGEVIYADAVDRNVVRIVRGHGEWDDFVIGKDVRLIKAKRKEDAPCED